MLGMASMSLEGVALGSSDWNCLNDLYLDSPQGQSVGSAFPQTARHLHTVVWSDVADGVYIFGGYDGGNHLNDLYISITAWEALLPAGSIPSARYGHTTVWNDVADSDGFYVFGGKDGGNWLNDVYLYHPEPTTTKVTLTTTTVTSTFRYVINSNNNIHDFDDYDTRAQKTE